MIELFSKYVQREGLFNRSQSVLIGVSGGVDSVVLCELMFQKNVKFAIAHCNFGLRGGESDGDDIFVASLAEKYDVDHHRVFFDTKLEAQKERVSIQMAARSLRFQWFDKIAKENNYDVIAVATHLNDDVETLFINLIRGTGLSGLTGIRPKNGKIVRPLLFATRKEILEFAKTQNLSWREDSSNADTKYVRNKIRHEVIPVLKELNPNIESVFADNISRFKEVESFLEQYIGNLKKELIRSDDTADYIVIKRLMKESHPRLILLNVLSEYGFNASQCSDIIQAIGGISGKLVIAPAYRLLVDREYLIVQSTQVKKELEEVQIDAHQKLLESPLQLKFQILDRSDFEIIKDDSVACLDFKSLKFPLTLRKWKEGDWFVPLGMHGKKKISDFLINKKTSLYKKQNTWVLLSEGQIVWVVGQRVDNRFKVENQSKKVYLIAPFSMT